MLEGWSFFWDLLPSVTVKLLAALLCGFLLGIERERKDKPAGLRTIVLITMGATLFMIVSLMIALVTEGPESITRVDPSRVASEVVAGIGFLGAGAIIQARGSVHGLTTAAVIWFAAGIGLAIGMGFPLISIGATLLALLVLVLLDPLTRWLSWHGDTDVLELMVRNDSLTFRRMYTILHQLGIRESEVESSQSDHEEYLDVRIVYSANVTATQRVLEALAQIDGVRGKPIQDTERHFAAGA